MSAAVQLSEVRGTVKREVERIDQSGNALPTSNVSRLKQIFEGQGALPIIVQGGKGEEFKFVRSFFKKCFRVQNGFLMSFLKCFTIDEMCTCSSKHGVN